MHIDNPEQENNIKIESQKLNLDISKREFEKQQSLYEKGGVTLRELKDSERSYIDSKYNHDNALIQLAKLKIRASFDGIIVDIPYYTQGTRLASGSAFTVPTKHDAASIVTNNTVSRIPIFFFMFCPP